MNISIAGGTNNVVTAVATSADTTQGVAPAKESVAITFSTGATNAGNVSVQLVDGSYNHTVVTSVAAGDSASTVAGKVFAKLFNDSSVTSHYEVSINGAVITLVDNTPGVNDTTVVTVK